MNPNIKSRHSHGFDPTKLGPASIFDMPSGAGASVSFFDNFGRGREPLDVDLWLPSAEVRDDGEAEEHAAKARGFEERWKDVPDDAQRASFEKMMAHPTERRPLSASTPRDSTPAPRSRALGAPARPEDGLKWEFEPGKRHFV
jgi:hypothetical protein